MKTKKHRNNYLLAFPDKAKASILLCYDTGDRLNFSDYPYSPTKLHYTELRAQVMNTPELKQIYTHLKESKNNGTN